MSWFWGSDGEPEEPKSFSDKFQPQIPPPSSGGDGEVSEKIQVTSGFDPSALERGAKAMRVLDESPNAQAALRLAMEQEKTKQVELKAYTEQQGLARAKQESQNSAQRNADEERRIKIQSQLNKEQAEHKAKLDMQMHQQKLEDQRRMQEEMQQRKHEEFLRQEEIRKKNAQMTEEMRRQTMKLKAEEDRKTSLLTAEAESKGRIRQERENADVQREFMVAKAAEDRQTQMETLKERYKHFSAFAGGVRDTLTDPEKLPLVVAGISAAALGIYGAKYGTKTAAKYIQSTMGKPSLVRETSRRNWIQQPLRSAWDSVGSLSRTPPSVSELLKGTVFHKNLESHLTSIATASMNTAKHNANFRHILCHGPPGTGKTLFAKKMAKLSGLDYAVLTGGDFAPLGRDAVTELHKTFDWAEQSDRGTILFIDEADAFLRRGRGEDGGMSEDMRNVLSAFLYRTGTESNKVMLMLASNIPDTLDKAVVDRIDEKVEFPLPGQEERSRLLRMYFDQYLVSPATDSDPIELDGFGEDGDHFDRWAKQTEGFSGRQLNKLIIAMQHAVYGGISSKLSPALADAVVKIQVKGFKAFQAGATF